MQLQLFVHFLDLEGLELGIRRDQGLQCRVDFISGLDNHEVDVGVCLGTLWLVYSLIIVSAQQVPLENGCFGFKLSFSFHFSLSFDEVLLFLEINDLDIGHLHLDTMLEAFNVFKCFRELCFFLAAQPDLEFFVLVVLLDVGVEASFLLVHSIESFSDVLGSELGSVMLELVDDVDVVFFLGLQVPLSLDRVDSCDAASLSS